MRRVRSPNKGELDYIRLFPELREYQDTPRVMIKTLAILCRMVWILWQERE